MTAPDPFYNPATYSAELLRLSGFDFVAALANEDIHPPAMAETLPFTLLPPEKSRVKLMAVPEARFFNLTNTIPGVGS